MTETENIADVILRNKSTLLVGWAGTGKTPILLEAARKADAPHGMRCIVVDASFRQGAEYVEAGFLDEYGELLSVDPDEILVDSLSSVNRSLRWIVKHGTSGDEVLVVVDEFGSLLPVPVPPKALPQRRAEVIAENQQRAELRKTIEELMDIEGVRLAIAVQWPGSDEVKPLRGSACRIQLTPAPTLEQVLTLGVVSFDAESDNRGEYAIIAEGSTPHRKVRVEKPGLKETGDGDE